MTVLLVGCSSSTGVLPVGPDTYTITERLSPMPGGGGDIVRLKGYLADVEWPERPRWIWKTALTTAENHAAHWDDNNPDCQTLFVIDVSSGQ